jgi:hypothetical protein
MFAPLTIPPPTCPSLQIIGPPQPRPTHSAPNSITRSSHPLTLPTSSPCPAPALPCPPPNTEAHKRTGLACNFSVLWYPGKYFPPLGSIIPLTDVTDAIPRDLVTLGGLTGWGG